MIGVMRKRMIIAGAATIVVVGAAGTGVAIAAGGEDDGPSSHQYTDAQRDAAVAAALEATGGGEANSVETDDENGATYEVEVTKPNGNTVDVRLDEKYQVVVIEGDDENADIDDSSD